MPYTCNCMEFCHGEERRVSKSTWYNHRNYRNPLALLPDLTASAPSQIIQIPPPPPLPPAVIPLNVTTTITAGAANSHTTSFRPSHSNSPLGSQTSMEPAWDDVLNEGTTEGNIGHSPESLDIEDGRTEAPPLPQHDVYGVDNTEDPETPATHVPSQEDEPLLNDNVIPLVSDLKIALDFKKAIENAHLNNGDLDEYHLNLLRKPPEVHGRITDRDLLLSLKLFISTTLAADQVYENVRLDVMDSHPEDDLLSHDAAKKAVAKLTGIVPIVNDMCPNSCMAYTGPWANLEWCPFCNDFRYDSAIYASSHGRKKLPRRHFYTIPIGPVIQAKFRTIEGARKMKHRQRETLKILQELERNEGIIHIYNDIYHGQEYLEAVQRGDIAMEDTLLIFSVDGAQLYQDKQSDCWMSLWLFGDLAPEFRYKKHEVPPGCFIPGPNNPKHPESFFFPGFHHLAAIQKEGLLIWDAETERSFVSHPFLHLGTADGPGSVHFTGLVGHHGAYPCRLYCPLKGRHKAGGSHYYPALLKPVNYIMEGCDHEDIHPRQIGNPSSAEYAHNLHYLLNSRNPTDYKERRKDTGISTISIFHGLPAKHRLPLPLGFPGDVMHVLTLNFGDLLPALWRGTFTCAESDNVRDWPWAKLRAVDVWQAHGIQVAETRQYLPGSYDRPPRNIALKISSGYKAKEWQGYLYGLAPALLYEILPLEYWQNFCKLVQAVRILHQRSITRRQLQYAQTLVEEFHFDSEIYL
ncbi:hypothetical protein H0H93_014743 [Arthromyces matolae]|nr:hypothetical protein H0H93_014743 [Arthromyces matolae]